MQASDVIIKLKGTGFDERPFSLKTLSFHEKDSFSIGTQCSSGIARILFRRRDVDLCRWVIIRAANVKVNFCD